MRDAYLTGIRIHPSVARIEVGEFTARVSASLGWPEERVSGAIDLLSLRPREDFLSPTPPHKPVDVYPWKFNRALSYMRRPFLRREGADRTEVLWGNRHLYNVMKYLVDLCVSARLKATSSQMKSLLAGLNSSQGTPFNETVAELFERQPGLIVRRRVGKIGSLRLKGPKGDLGDIDTLIVDPIAKRIKPVECKDLARARAPHEMANEIANLFLGQNGKASFVEKHQRRVDWLREHIGEVLDWLQLPHDGDWQVEPLIVVDQELMTPYLYASPIRVVAFAELDAELSARQLSVDVDNPSSQ